MAELTREEKLAEIQRINRLLSSGVTEVTEDDRRTRWDLNKLQERRDELLGEIGGGEAAPSRAAQVRQIRMVGSKGY